jgi:hypothetical protein
MTNAQGRIGKFAVQAAIRAKLAGKLQYLTKRSGFILPFTLGSLPA